MIGQQKTNKIEIWEAGSTEVIILFPLRILNGIALIAYDDGCHTILSCKLQEYSSHCKFINISINLNKNVKSNFL